MTYTPEQMKEMQEHPLYGVFMSAIAQAMFGKGERHGGKSVPFLEQPLFHYVKMHGRGFATGQAAKKLEEAASTRHGVEFEKEVLGAIVYAGAAVLSERKAAGQVIADPMAGKSIKDIVKRLDPGAVFYATEAGKEQVFSPNYPTAAARNG